MGLGKTIQAIASMSAFKDDWPLLIIAPCGAKINWKNELLRWLKLNRNSKKDNNTVLVLNENKIKMLTKKDEDVKGLLKGKQDEVVITSFEIARDNKTLERGMFKAVIVDESHILKNKKGKATKRITVLLEGANRVILLSGTPALSKPSDLETQLKLVAATKDERVFEALTECHFEEKTGFVEKMLLSLELGLRVQTYIIRRLKGSTSCALPPLRREIEYVDEDEGIKSKSQSFLRSSDGAQAKTLRRTLKRDNGGENAEMARELLGGDEDEVEAESDDPVRDKSEYISLRRAIGMAKAHRVVPVIEKFIEENEEEKLIIFAHHVDVLDFLEAQFPKEISIRISGSVRGIERQNRIDSFQDGTKRLAFLSIKACGVAINLTASCKVFFVEFDWSPFNLLQAEARSHRLGQTKQVDVTYFVLKNSLDIPMMLLIKQKFDNIKTVSVETCSFLIFLYSSAELKSKPSMFHKIQTWTSTALW